MELHSESSAKNSVKCRPDSPGVVFQRVFKSQSFRTQNTVFLPRKVRDGDFPRASHKSLLSHNVSERVRLHVLREE